MRLESAVFRGVCGEIFALFQACVGKFDTIPPWKVVRLMVNKISNQTVHHQSATKFAPMLQDIKNYQPVKLLKYLLHI